jgi:hypothetical protein
MPKHRNVNTMGEPSGTGCVTAPMLALRDEWRSLWEQHVAWTRMTIESAAFGSPDFPQVSARLLQNAQDMGAAVRPWYGDAAGTDFAMLIRDHLLIAIRLVSAAKAGDTAGAAQAEKEWYANADAIAAFLAGANPYWSAQEWRSMFYEHLALTKDEAVATLTGDYQKSAGTYDEIEREALLMADTVSGGIMRQFPRYFA